MNAEPFFLFCALHGGCDLAIKHIAEPSNHQAGQRHFQIAVPCICDSDKSEQCIDIGQNDRVIIITNRKFPPVFLKKVRKKDAVKQNAPGLCQDDDGNESSGRHIYEARKVT